MNASKPQQRNDASSPDCINIRLLSSSGQMPTPLGAVHSVEQLADLSTEIRDVLCNLLATRTAHFASNLGVVELCLALHCGVRFSAVIG